MFTKIKNWIKDKWQKFKRKFLATFGIAAALAAGTTGTIAVDNQINPYTEKTNTYEMSIANNDRVSILKNEPAIELKKWNGESSLKVIYSDRGNGKKSSRKFLSKEIRWAVNSDKDVVMQPVDVNEGGFEIDIELSKKPRNNVFTYYLENWEDLDFFYQKEPSQEAIAQGVVMPENVIGSYAVYHKTKRNYQAGDIDYKIGKLFHIYRPEVIDADGNKIWAKLYIENGIMTVTVPQSFLDTAVYPVKVDPTFGYTSIGASGWGYSDSTEAFQGSRQYLSKCANISSITAYTRGAPGASSTQPYSYALYFSPGDEKGIKEASGGYGTTEGADLSQTWGWYTLSYGTSTDVLPTYYIIGEQAHGGYYWTAFDYATDKHFYHVRAYNGSAVETPARFSRYTSADNVLFSIYATYTVNTKNTATCFYMTDFEGFESETDADKTFDNNWVNDTTTDDCDWQAEQTTTGSTGTGPSEGEYGGTMFIYTETSTGTSNCETTGDIAYLDYNGPMPDIGGRLDFHYSMYGSAMGTLSVEGYDGSSWTELWSLSGNQGDNWSETISVTLAATTTDIRFKGVRGSSYTSDMSLDDIIIWETPPAASINLKGGQINLKGENINLK